MRSRVFILAVAALLVSVSSADADALSFSFAEVSYLGASFDESGVNANGVGVAVSWALLSNLHVFVSYANLAVERTDVRSISTGAGLSRAVAPSVDLFLEFAYVSSEGGGNTADGGGIEAGVRANLASRVEGYVSGGYASFREAGNVIDGSLGIAVSLSGPLSATAFVSVSDDEDTESSVGYGAGLRAYFP